MGASRKLLGRVCPNEAQYAAHPAELTTLKHSRPAIIDAPHTDARLDSSALG
jgi:hypothetical protein